ncbi:MAG: FAD-dependent monooxygenase [Xanthobacteraceae bacterium]|nr:FAD-dependent monooxygenase [Xanthobacteraceae bacterium]
MTKRKIVIAGAGIGGLATACCLLERGFDVDVYEQAPMLSEVGAGIQISANAMHVLRYLGLGDAILRVGVQPKAYVFRLHDTGEVVQAFALSEEHQRQHGAPYIQLHRADLHDLLVAKARELKADVVRLNHKAVGFTERDGSIELRFAHGASARGDLLIGADGLKSAIRAQLFGNVQPTYTGDGVWRITAPTERLPPASRLDQVMSVFMGPGGHAVCYYLRSGALLNFGGTVEAPVSEESWTLKFPWENLKADFAGWHPAIQAIIDAADHNECYRWSLHNRPPIRTWSKGCVTILGDAAHPTLPYLAQGAAMAIEDGAVLTRALEQEHSIPEALDLYQRNRVDRTARVVEQSNANQKLFHLHSAQEIRQKFAKRDEGSDRNSWLYSYNPLTVELK